MAAAGDQWLAGWCEYPFRGWGGLIFRHIRRHYNDRELVQSIKIPFYPQCADRFADCRGADAALIGFMVCPWWYGVGERRRAPWQKSSLL